MRSNQGRMVPFNREDVAFRGRHSTHNELKVHREMNHIAGLQGPTLEGRWRQVHR